MAKATRGAVARSLLVAGVGPVSPDELAKALVDLGYQATLDAPARKGAPRSISITAAG